MACKIKNKYGEIRIEDEVIAKVAGLAAMDCYGVVGMAAKNAKDGLFQLLKKENLTKGITISSCNGEDTEIGDGQGIVIEVHIIVEYGTNIGAICESLISTVKYNTENSIGVAVDSINVFVEGMRV